MKEFWLKLRHPFIYKHYKARVKGVKFCDWVRGMENGYYLDVDRLTNIDKLSHIEKFELGNGKYAYYKLIWVDFCGNPADMIKRSYWQLINYEGQKKLKQMTFEEFMNCVPKCFWNRPSLNEILQVN